AAAQERSDLEMIEIPRVLTDQAQLCRSMGLALTYMPEQSALVTVVTGERIVIRV
ncbi:MAG: recombinase family protein, partial [Sphaerisporangium sp.]|nr:recombinase family protein [Sphaerisporangium sp.]